MSQKVSAASKHRAPARHPHPAGARARDCALARAARTIALVPTMGALHAGHLALVRRAQRRADRVIVSIFVNPTQFAPHEDLKPIRVPSPPTSRHSPHLKTDLVWAPSVETMYPPGFATRIVPEGPATAGLEDAFRPHFFAGVATVVAKLLIQCEPDIAVFGEKDYQQLKVVTQLARDLDLETRIVGAPTVRETDGLALSSRNAYLSASERDVAPTLHRVLADCAEKIAAGRPIERGARARPRGDGAAGFALDYLEARHAERSLPSRRERTPAPPARRRAARQNAADRQYSGVDSSRRASLAAALHRILHRLIGRELHAVELAVHLLDLADVDVLHDVAGLGSIEIGPRGLSQAMPFIAASNASPSALPFGLLERLIDQVHAIIAADRNEVRAKAVRLLEGRDIGLVERRIVRGGIRPGGDHAEHLVAHGVEIVVVGQIARADDLDAGTAEPAFGELLGEDRRPACPENK